MLEISLGEPEPGDPLPPYEEGQTADMALLRNLAVLLNFTGTDLYMEYFELRELMRLKLQRDQADDDWVAINVSSGKRPDGNEPETPNFN